MSQLTTQGNHIGFRIRGVFYRLRQCYRCGGNIALVPTDAGKLQPTDADGVNHFRTCPVLIERRRVRRSHRPTLIQPLLIEEAE